MSTVIYVIYIYGMIQKSIGGGGGGENNTCGQRPPMSSSGTLRSFVIYTAKVMGVVCVSWVWP